MNHPTKNKKNPTAMPTDTGADDRNLIDLEEAVELSIEEKIRLLWIDHKQSITSLVTLALLAILSFNGAKLYQNYKIEQLQAAYSEARASETLAEFSTRYQQHKLGAFAALNVADQGFKDKDYTLAARYYAQAASALNDHWLLGRARLGEAFAYYEQGEETKGLTLLRSLSADSSLAESARAEAAYHLAIAADAAGDTTGFERYQSQIDALALAGQWQQRLTYYQRQSTAN